MSILSASSVGYVLFMIISYETIRFQLADIPSTLIEAFRATLNDAIDAHLIVHVCDASHPDRVVQRQTVLQTLRDLNLSTDKLQTMITVNNKIDLLNDAADSHMQHAVDNSTNENELFISCRTRQGFQQLLHVIEQRLLVASDRIIAEYRVLQGGELYQILVHGQFCAIEYMIVDDNDPQYIRLKCLFSKIAYDKFQARYTGASKYRLESSSSSSSL
jgi:50S ribosomal subunit-associated GTPase HflX